MHAMKQAHLAKERTGADVYELYIDIRAAGKGYEEFYERVQREGVIFIRGRGAEVIPMDGKLVVKAEDTGLGRPIILAVDMVVLVTGMEPHEEATGSPRRSTSPGIRTGSSWKPTPSCGRSTQHRRHLPGRHLPGAPRHPDTVAHANAAAPKRCL